VLFNGIASVGADLANRHRKIAASFESEVRHTEGLAAALQRAEAAAPAALGLALQRLCELDYASHPHGAHLAHAPLAHAPLAHTPLAHALLRLQRREGLFGPEQVPAETLIAASAVALRGLIDWSERFAEQDERAAIFRGAIQRGWCALSAAFVAGTLQRRAWDDVAWAIVLWQLAECPEAHQRLPIAAIRRRLTSEPAALTASDDLTRLALLAA